MVGLGCATDAQGGPTAGVAALCNWPVDVRVLPNNCRNTLVDGSASAVFAAFAFGESMFTRFNRTEACKLAHVLFETMSILGEDVVFIGDWNNTPEEEPAITPARNGMLHLGDDVEGPSCILAPTRHNGRHIEYALHSFNVHDLVTFTFKVANLEPTF